MGASFTASKIYRHYDMNTDTPHLPDRDLSFFLLPPPPLPGRDSTRAAPPSPTAGPLSARVSLFLLDRARSVTSDHYRRSRRPCAPFPLLSLSTSCSSCSVPPPRALFGGAGGNSVSLEYVQVDTTGNGTDFGDLTVNATLGASGSSTTRALFGGQADDNARIDTVEIFTTGNATDFGDLTKSRKRAAGLSNNTRCMWFMGQGANGSTDWSDIIDYVTIASLGNATDFGDTLGGQYDGGSGAGSSTRGVVGGGQSTSSTSSVVNVLQYVTISSAGNSTDFGDLTLARRMPAALSSSTRAVWGGGRDSSNSNTNVMDYITIASTGNATDFGDLDNGGSQQNEGTGSNTRGIFGPALAGSSPYNRLEYITIASTGNSTTFGTLSGNGGNAYGAMACSSAHGGLQ